MRNKERKGSTKELTDSSSKYGVILVFVAYICTLYNTLGRKLIPSFMSNKIA